MARFSEEDRATIWNMREAGVPVKRIAKHLGRQNSSLRRFIADAGGRRPTACERSELRLSLDEREEISRGLAAGHSIRAIAEALGRSPSTLCREVNLNGGRKKYRALVADRAACRRARRPEAGRSSPSAGDCEGSSSASSRPNGHPSRSRRGLGSGVLRSPGDAGVARDHLPIALRPEPWSAGARSSIRAYAAVEPCAGPRPYTKGGVGQGKIRNMVDDLRAPCRGEGPRGAGSLGGRPDLWERR